jgi:hypothetical protein
MLIVPTKPLASQILAIQLGGQNCSLNIYQTAYGLFMDVNSNGALIIGGVICQNLNRIIRDAYLGFIGDFAWIDNSGLGGDPVFNGLGSTYSLVYLSPSDLNGAG